MLNCLEIYLTHVALVDAVCGFGAVCGHSLCCLEEAKGQITVLESKTVICILDGTLFYDTSIKVASFGLFVEYMPSRGTYVGQVGARIWKAFDSRLSLLKVCVFASLVPWLAFDCSRAQPRPLHVKHLV